MTEPKVGLRMGSPYYIEAVRQEIVTAFGAVAASEPIRVSDGHISMSAERWDDLQARVDDILERRITVAIRAVMEREKASSPSQKDRDEVAYVIGFADGCAGGSHYGSEFVKRRDRSLAVLAGNAAVQDPALSREGRGE